MIKVFESIVMVSPFADGVYWYLRAPLKWLAYDDTEISVPTGFVTDFASIPRPLWSIFPKWERYGPAAVVHDFLYWDQSRERDQADRYMLEAMKDSDVSWLKRRTIYAAIHFGGWFAWRRNRREKESGGIRQLLPEQYPTNPSETWEECQRRIKGQQ